MSKFRRGFKSGNGISTERVFDVFERSEIIGEGSVLEGILDGDSGCASRSLVVFN